MITQCATILDGCKVSGGGCGSGEEWENKRKNKRSLVPYPEPNFEVFFVNN
jgi:hypothetical protein